MAITSNCFSDDKVFKDKIAQGNASIEKCLEEIEAFLKEVTSDAKASRDSTSCLSEEHLFSSVLNNLVYAFSENTGLEELLLPHLEELRKQNGLKLLNILPTEKDLQEKGPYNQLENIDMCLAWQKFCYYIVKYVRKKLNDIIAEFDTLENFSFSKPLLCFYLKCLSGIIVPAQLWELHKSIRLNVLKQMQCSCSSDNQDVCYKCLLTVIAYCIREDKELIYNGYFQPLVITWMEITKTYIPIISSVYTRLLMKIDEARKTDCGCCLTDEQIQCFKGLTASCHQMLENNLFKLEENSVSILNSKLHKDLEEYIQKFGLGKNSTTATVLLKIIEMTHAFENNMILLSEGLSQKTLCCHSNAFECASEGTLLMVPVDSPEQSPVHLITDNNHSSVPFSWNWRLSFQDLGLLAFIQRYLQEVMQRYVQVCLPKEWKLFLSSKEVPSVLVQFSHQSVKKPINMLFSIAVIIRELDRFSSLLAASQGALLPFRSSFHHVLHTYVIEVLPHIERIAATVPQNKPIGNLYIVTTSTYFLKERLKLYNNQMCGKDNNQSDSSILGLHERVTKLQETLLQKIIYYHRKLLLGGVLQDAESHCWNHHKPFFEGCRISFSVQMWNLYLVGIMNDLKHSLPSCLFQEIMILLVDETLQHLSTRYARATPSEVRVNQYRSDIIAILLYVTELLPSISSSLFQLIGKEHCILNNDYPNMQLISSIHNHCSMLLTLLAVLTSPLPMLYKVIKKGFPILSASLRQKVSHNATWLSWIQPGVYPHIGQGMLMSSSFVWLNVKLCVAQPEANPFMVIKAYASHSSTLSILFMNQANELSYGKDKHSSGLKSENEESKLKLSRVLLSMLQYCYYQPECLASILLPVIERSNGWKEFDESSTFKLSYQRPWWYRALNELFRPVSKSVLNTVIPLIIEKNKIMLINLSESKWHELKENLLKHFDCSCNYPFTEVSTDKSTVIGSVLDIIVCLKDQLVGLSCTLVTCLSNLDARLGHSQKHIKPLFNSLPLQVLLSDLCITLKEQQKLEELIGKHFTKNLSNVFSSISETLFTILHTDEMTIEVDEQQMKLAIEHAAYIKKFFQKSSCKGTESFGQEKNTSSDQEVEDDCLRIITSEFLQFPDGHHYIKYLYQLLRENLAWIQYSLGIPSTLSTDVVVSSVSPSPLPNEEFVFAREHQNLKNNLENIIIAKECASVDDQSNLFLPGAIVDDQARQLQYVASQTNLLYQSDSSVQQYYFKNKMNETYTLGHYEHQSPELKLDVTLEDISRRTSFNPLSCFDKIGDCPIDQELLINFPFPWESLLDHTPLLGLTETGLKMLLMHRWEFIGKEPLPAGYDKYVHLLKSQYGLDQDDENYHNH